MLNNQRVYNMMNSNNPPPQLQRCPSSAGTAKRKSCTAGPWRAEKHGMGDAWVKLGAPRRQVGTMVKSMVNDG